LRKGNKVRRNAFPVKSKHYAELYERRQIKNFYYKEFKLKTGINKWSSAGKTFVFLSEETLSDKKFNQYARVAALEFIGKQIHSIQIRLSEPLDLINITKQQNFVLIKSSPFLKDWLRLLYLLKIAAACMTSLI
jgi:hypothetical protein